MPLMSSGVAYSNITIVVEKTKAEMTTAHVREKNAIISDPTTKLFNIA